MKVLTFSTLFPNRAQPRHGIFIENRLRHLVKTFPQVSIKVVAPVPWFPFKQKMFGSYAQFAQVPKQDQRDWVDVYHPRYCVIPKVGMNWTPYFLAQSALPVIKKLQQSGFDFDLIDAHYFYPDGVAAMLIAEKLQKPYICTARGTDISLIPQYAKPRERIARSIQSASHVITVCQALADEITALKFTPNALSTLRNGVDLTGFSPPSDREALRQGLGFKGYTLLSVGHLIERKGHHLIIEALPHLPNVNLVIAGGGEMASTLKQLASQLNVADRVTFLGEVPHDKLKDYYGAADAMILASSREGWANVLLESMACGTPVVATSIWGTPEVVKPHVGVLVDQRSGDGIAKGVMALQEKAPLRSDVRQYAEGFSWDETSNNLYSIMDSVKTA